MKQIVFLFSILLLFCGGCLTSGGFTRDLTKENSGDTFQLETGDTIRITLESNPTTGYMWAVDGVPDSDVVRLVKNEFIVPDTKMCGAPGKQQFVYKVFGPGEAGIRLAYRRSWEKETPADIFQVKVISVKTQSFIERLDQSNVVTPRVGSRGQIEPPVGK